MLRVKSHGGAEIGEAVATHYRRLPDGAGAECRGGGCFGGDGAGEAVSEVLAR